MQEGVFQGLRKMLEGLRDQKNAVKFEGLEEYRKVRGRRKMQGKSRLGRIHEALRAQKNAGRFEGSEECGRLDAQKNSGKFAESEECMKV